MADDLISSLRPLIVIRALRDGAAKFMSLPREAVDSLMTLVEEHGSFDIPASKVAEFESAYSLDGDGRSILEAARIIRAAVRRIDQADERNRTLTRLAELVNTDAFGLEHFSALFSSQSQLDREELRTTAIRVAPTLVGVSLYSDLRVVSDPPNVDWGLVPVVVARLGFDEQVAGQQALFVQLTEESLAELKREIEKTQETLRTVRDRIGSDLLFQGNDDDR